MDVLDVLDVFDVVFLEQVEELEDALVRMKMAHTGLEVEGMIYLFDFDQDGLLDYREFLQLVTGKRRLFINLSTP